MVNNKQDMTKEEIIKNKNYYYKSTKNNEKFLNMKLLHQKKLAKQFQKLDNLYTG